MSISSEVKRTLVKSPPELWSELGDSESLERHLGDLGEIQVTRIESERAVDWEAKGASGSVRLEPSGFGTKVTLSLTRELSEPATASEQEPATAEPAAEQPTDTKAEPAIEVKSQSEPVVQAELESESSEPAVQADLESESQPVVTAELDSESEAATAAKPEPRRGFFARLFRRKSLIDTNPAITTVTDEEIDTGPTVLDVESTPPESVPTEPEPALAPEPTPEPKSEPPVDLAVDLAALEAEIAAQDEALLTAVLDRLGAAHHRPFSRS